MPKQWTSIVVLASILMIAGAAVAQTPTTKSDTYTWHGEFVSLDATAKTMTVKSRVAYQEALSELKKFKPGDRVWIVWSGVHDYSEAVRQIRRSQAGRAIDENLVLPAELVSTEAPDQYVTIRMKVPETALSTLKDLKPGEWITVTARHRPKTEDEAVVAVKPYGSTTPSE